MKRIRLLNAMRFAAFLASSLGSDCSGGTLLHEGYRDFFIADIEGATASHGGMTVDSDGSIILASEGARKILRLQESGVVDVLGVADAGVRELQDVTRLSSDELLITAIWRPQFLTLGLSGDQGLDPFHELQGTRNPLATELAPNGFGMFGGQLIFSNFGLYGVEAFNLNTKTVGPVASIVNLSDIEFSNEGRLFGVNFLGSIVVEVKPDGLVLEVAKIPKIGPGGWSSQPDGLAIHPVTGNLYVAEPINNVLYEIDTLGHVSLFAQDIDFDDGFSVSALEFSLDGTTLYYSEGESHHAVRGISGFPAVPEPSAALDCLVAVTAIAIRRIGAKDVQ